MYRSTQTGVFYTLRLVKSQLRKDESQKYKKWLSVASHKCQSVYYVPESSSALLAHQRGGVCLPRRHHHRQLRLVSPYAHRRASPSTAAVHHSKPWPLQLQLGLCQTSAYRVGVCINIAMGRGPGVCSSPRDPFVIPRRPPWFPFAGAAPPPPRGRKTATAPEGLLNWNGHGDGKLLRDRAALINA